MKRYKINLITMSDCSRFVNIAVLHREDNIKLTDGKDYTVNGKSLLGAICSMEWSTVYCIVPDNANIYEDIKDFIAEE